ncbi:MAG: DUF3501 family protein [Candidatus Dadabacteria bacterium]|nr:MAG: DUF3501 family protein [Candidatus Dadabacteria bacterium]
MQPVRPSEILSLEDYEIARPRYRQRVLAIKAPRRVAVGEHLTLLFENRDTVLYQIQEMLRIERITDPKAIRHEIETYNELVPGDDELTATLLIEFPDATERDRRLRELLGLERHVHLDVEGKRCDAVFDERQWSDERISSVHYLRFPLGRSSAEAIRSGARPVIVVDHPALEARVQLTEEQRAALAEDLSS